MRDSQEIDGLEIYGSEFGDIIIAIRELAKTGAKEASLGYFNGKGEVKVTVKR